MGVEETDYLVQRAQKGDTRAVEELFRRYLPRVRQIVALRLGYRRTDSDALDDLVQESLLRVFENLDKYQAASEGRFRHWIATCVANSVRNCFRDARAEKRGGGRVRTFAEVYPADLASSIFPGKEPTPSAILAGKDALEKIEAALMALDERDRELIILRRLCEMSYAEIAEVVGLKEVAARQAFHRAISRLEEACGLNGAGGGPR
jgi:RNA polymerase sigma-70 factor (ECF subfamily)